MSLINILRKISDKKASGLSLVDEPRKGNTVATVINTSANKKKYIVSSDRGENALEVESKRYVIEPYIPLTRQHYFIGD